MLIILYLRLISLQVSEQPENIDAWLDVMVDKYTESKDVGRENPTAGGLSCQTYTTLEEITSFRDDLWTWMTLKLGEKETSALLEGCKSKHENKQNTVPLFIFYKINRLYEIKWKQTRECSM